MSVVRGFSPSSKPLTAEEEARFRALAEREANFGPAAMSWIPGLLATLDAARLDAETQLELCPDCTGTGYVRHSGDMHFHAIP